MQIRVLQLQELANASGLSRYVFDNCLKNRMEFPQTIAFVEEYISENNLRSMVSENKLMVWGVFEQQQLVGVSALQSDGMITMLYVLPQCWRRGYGKGLLTAMREYGKQVYEFERVTLNATPAWTSGYFVRQGFSYVQPQQNLNVPFIPLYALSSKMTDYPKRRVPAKVMILAGVGCFLFATIVGIIFMISYMM